MFSPLLKRFKMFHFVRFITWLLLLPLSNQELVNWPARYYQRTILNGLIQSQAACTDTSQKPIDINPQAVYTFLQTSGATLSEQISGETFQEIKDKFGATLAEPMVNFETYQAIKDEFGGSLVSPIGNGPNQTSYNQLFKQLYHLYRKYINGQSELDIESKQQVRLASHLLTQHLRLENELGFELLNGILASYQKWHLDPHLLYEFLVEAMQDADSTLNIEPSTFRDYLVKLELFDSAFNPTAKPKTDWDFRQAWTFPCDIFSVLSMYYEGEYSKPPAVKVDGTAELSAIARQWTQAYRKYLKEKLHLVNLKQDHAEFMCQRQTEFICGFAVTFRHLEVTSSDENLSVDSPNTGSKGKDNIESDKPLKDGTSEAQLFTSWCCFLKRSLGAGTGVGFLSVAYYYRHNISKWFYSPDNGSIQADPNTTKPNLTSSPDVKGTSSTLWWIVCISGVAAFLGGAFWIYYSSSDDESSKTEKEEEMTKKKKKQPRMEEKPQKKRTKVKAKKRVVRKKILPSPLNKGTPPSAASSPNAPKVILSSQAPTKSRATQTPLPKAVANKTKRSTERRKAQEKPKPDLTNIFECTTSGFPAPNGVLAGPKEMQTPSSVTPPPKHSQSVQKIKRSKTANKTKLSTERKKAQEKPDEINIMECTTSAFPASN